MMFGYDRQEIKNIKKYILSLICIIVEFTYLKKRTGYYFFYLVYIEFWN